jgi:hypothetical protein
VPFSEPLGQSHLVRRLELAIELVPLVWTSTKMQEEASSVKDPISLTLNSFAMGMSYVNNFSY